MGEHLGYGLRSIPEEVTVAWGARLIFPDDLLHDRQSWIGDPDQRAPVVDWLNGGALKGALTEARQMADEHRLRQSDTHTVTLYEDELGTVLGSPQGSFGYLYVAGWLK